MAKIVCKEIMDGEQYYYMSDGMWVNSSFTKVTKPEMYKLEKIRLKKIDLNSMSFENRVRMAQTMKDNENFSDAIKIFDGVLEECNDVRVIKFVLPCYTSILRKFNKPEEAISFADEYIHIYGEMVKTQSLYTSLAGAYCDIGDYIEARKKANIAYALCNGKANQELISVYARINSMEK